MFQLAANRSQVLMNTQTKLNTLRWISVFQVFGLLGFVVLGWTMPSSFSETWQTWTSAWIFGCAIFHLWLRYLSGDRDWLSPDKLFIGAYFYFHFDYLIAYLLGVAEYSDQVFAFPAYANLTTYLISLCLFFFLVGYNLQYQFNNQKLLSRTKQFELQLDRKSLFVGKMMILLGFVFVVIFIFQIGLSTLLNRSYGFNLFYSGEYDYSFFSQGKSILAVGVIFFVLDWFQTPHNTRRRKLLNLFLLALVAIYVLALLFLFSVRSWLLLDVFIPGLLIYHYFRQRVSIRFLSIAIIAVLFLSVIIEMSRTTDVRTLSGFIDQFQENQITKKYNISDLITTQWRTYKNVNEALALVDAENCWFYGSTLVGGLFDSVPFAGKYLNQGRYESPSIWLSRNLEPWYYINHEGIGFSLPAEMYINFGLFGAALIFLFLGYWCARFYANVSSLLLLVLYVTFLPNFLFSIRQTVSSFMRPVIIAFLIVIIIQSLSRTLRTR